MNDEQTSHSPGSRVFLLNGRECEYVAAAGAIHLVAQVYETEYGDELGSPFTADRVFSEPPTEKLHAEVSDLTNKVAALRQQHWSLASEIRDSERSNKERIKNLSRYKALELIEDFVEGRITHCVITSEYGRKVEVKPISEALKKDDRYDRGMKLLSLFGGSNGELTWRRNRYSDGSGSGWNECEPFCSESAAMEKAKEILCTYAAEVLADERKAWSYANDVLTSMAAIGMEAPQELANLMDEMRKSSATAAVEKARKQLEDAEAALAQVSA